MTGPVRSLAAIAACLLLTAQMVHAETPIDSPEGIDQRFEIASKDFGEGVVQLHSRKDGADGVTHTVHSFDCANKSFAPMFSGNSDPALFPMDSLGFNLEPIDQNSDVAALAQHTCKKHGYPLLEW